MNGYGDVEGGREGGRSARTRKRPSLVLRAVRRRIRPYVCVVYVDIDGGPTNKCQEFAIYSAVYEYCMQNE